MAKYLQIRDSAKPLQVFPFDGYLEESTVTSAGLSILDDASTSDMRATLGVTGLTWKEDGSTVAVSGVDNGVDDLVTAIDFQSNITATLNGTTLEIDATGGGGEAFPVGAVYINYTGTDPATELGYGSWQLMGTKEFSSI